MALITCVECGRSVSDRADACPQCGCPVNNTPSPMGNTYRDLPGVQTTQKTSKPLKFFILLAFLTMIAGCVGYSSNRSDDDLSRAGAWAVLCMFGFVSFVAGQFARWWNHG